MKFKYIKHAFTGLIMTASGMGNAGLITIGNLTLENAGDIYVTDTVNNVDYMRWDQHFNLTLAQIIRATVDPGNALHGWNVASSLQANNFTDALLADQIEGSKCKLTGNDDCGTPTGGKAATTLLLGDNYLHSSSFYTSFFDQTSPTKAGLLFMSDGTLKKYHSPYTVQYVDEYSTGELGDHLKYTYLLTRASLNNNITVPEPSTLAIFALGLIGLASRRFKK